MEQEYTTSTGYKIFYGAAAFALVAFTLFLVGINNNNSGSQNYAILILPVIGLIGAVLIVINLFKRKITVSDHSIARTNVWGTKEIDTKNIKGFRIGDKAIHVYPLDENQSKLSITDYISIGNVNDLKAWLNTNFRDLDKVEFEEEKEAILHDTAFGATETDREELFNKTRKYANVYNSVGAAFLIVPLILKLQYPALSAVMLLYPLAGIAMIIYSKGLIKLVGKKSSAYAAVFTGMMLPAFALVFDSFTFDQIEDYNKVWWPVAIIGVIFFGILYFAAISKTKDAIPTQLFIALMISAAYGFGSIIEVNCTFDQSIPKVFTVNVIDHHISHGKSTTYHITIDEWRPNYSSENVTVSSSFYYDAPVGSKVKVNAKQGLLNIPWYYLSK